MNVAFDANIWVSFTIGKHLAVLSHILLDPVLSERLRVHGCAGITAEYEQVMKRPKLKKYANPVRVQETLELIARVVEEHSILSDKVTGSRDVKDNYLLALAQAVPLDYLITGDRDLLVLEQWQQTRIITFSDFTELFQSLT